MKKIIMISTMLATLAGCTTSPTVTSEHYSQEDIDSIQKGVTTENTVLQMFGTPISQTVDALGNKKYRWTYEYDSGGGDNRVEIKALDVTTNKKGVVEFYSSSLLY